MGTTVLVADGKAGLVEQVDRRFEEHDWPICFDVPLDDADEWMTQFEYACSQRGWSCSGLGQIERAENSGTLYVRESEGGKPPLVTLVWQRPRTGPLQVKVRPGPLLQGSATDALFEVVANRVRSRFRETHYRLGFLEYFGRPWRGEVWMNDHLRLGPPARYPEAIYGPQVVRVDANVLGVGGMDANAQFSQRTQEIAIFLTVVLRKDIRVPGHEQLWAWVPEAGTTHCDIRQRGYWEPCKSTTLPARGLSTGIPSVCVQRPDLAEISPLSERDEVVLPEDIHVLWSAFETLDDLRRRQFLEAGMTFQLALRIWTEFRSASLALLVVACEALKPRGTASKKRHGRRIGFFEIVQATLGRVIAGQLRLLELNPQGLRDHHLHLGKLFGAELDPLVFASTYRDPTFDDVHRLVTRIAAAVFVEWLRRGGDLIATKA
jgi:hypothetical protein